MFTMTTAKLRMSLSVASQAAPWAVTRVSNELATRADRSRRAAAEGYCRPARAECRLRTVPEPAVLLTVATCAGCTRRRQARYPAWPRRAPARRSRGSGRGPVGRVGATAQRVVVEPEVCEIRHCFSLPRQRNHEERLRVANRRERAPGACRWRPCSGRHTGGPARPRPPNVPAVSCRAPATSSDAGGVSPAGPRPRGGHVAVEYSMRRAACRPHRRCRQHQLRTGWRAAAPTL